MKRLLFVCVCFTLAVNIASAQQGGARQDLPRLAVVEFDVNVTTEKARADSVTVRNLVESQMVATRKYQVITRTDIDRLLANQRIAVSSISSTENIRKLQLQNISYIVTGSVDALGNDYAVTVRMLDVSTGQFSHSANDFVGGGPRDLYTGVNALATRFASGMSADGGRVVQTEQAAPQTAQRILPKDLTDVFGASGVTAALNAVHAFLQACNAGSAEGRRERIAQRIMLGDWIDLPRLAVQGDAGGGAINTSNIDLGAKGKLLRLIVVGIDSFAVTNRNAPAHLVFQFQNVPGTHRMNASNTNSGGYRESEMRRYLTGNFLRGLLAAGVPEGVLYAPTRYIANGGPGASAADALADWLWLPTERELFENGTSYYDGDKWGPWSHATWETAANQARLEYYQDNSQRIKYDTDGDWWWWVASPYAASAAYFARVTSFGTAHYNNASAVGGCAPAFCVR